MANIISDKIVDTINTLLATKEKTSDAKTIATMLNTSYSTAYNILVDLTKFNIVHRIKNGKAHKYALINSPQTKALLQIINERKRIQKGLDRSPINDKDVVVIAYNNKKMIIGSTGASIDEKMISEDTFLDNISKKPEVIPRMIVLSNYDRFYNLIWLLK